MPHDEEENFTDEVIEDFFDAIEPICHIGLNQHSLDIINNMAVITVFTKKLIISLEEENDEDTAIALQALNMCYPHSPVCYTSIVDRLESVWREIFDEEYLEHLFSDWSEEQ